jgi:Flp pilus assembly protein TadG
MKTRISIARRHQGTAMVEFMFSIIILTPLLLGTIAIGLALIRQIQVTQLCRDAGHMWAYGVDFSQTANQNLIIQVAGPLGITRTGGNGAIVLSTITHIDLAACQAAGYNSSTCTNINQNVLIRRVVVGSNSFTSNFLNPSSSLLDSTGNIAASNYLTNSGLRETAFTQVALSAGQYAFLAEVFVTPSNFNYYGSLGRNTNALAIF